MAARKISRGWAIASFKLPTLTTRYPIGCSLVFKSTEINCSLSGSWTGSLDTTSCHRLYATSGESINVQLALYCDNVHSPARRNTTRKGTFFSVAGLLILLLRLVLKSLRDRANLHASTSPRLSVEQDDTTVAARFASRAATAKSAISFRLSGVSLAVRPAAAFCACSVVIGIPLGRPPAAPFRRAAFDFAVDVDFPPTLPLFAPALALFRSFLIGRTSHHHITSSVGRHDLWTQTVKASPFANPTPLNAHRSVAVD